jgi:hypothetical protein
MNKVITAFVAIGTLFDQINRRVARLSGLSFLRASCADGT